MYLLTYLQRLSLSHMPSRSLITPFNPSTCSSDRNVKEQACFALDLPFLHLFADTLMSRSLSCLSVVAEVNHLFIAAITDNCLVLCPSKSGD